MFLLAFQLGCAGEFEVKEIEPIDTSAGSEPSLEPGTEPADEPNSDQNDIDNDNDGFSENQGDCDDTTGAASPANQEIPYDGIDNDCNPITLDDDLDQDGYGVAEGDCDDDAFGINPGMPDDDCNDFDENCNGVADENWNDDPNENNDQKDNATDIGSVDDDSPMNIGGFLYPDGDVDLYMFSAIDGWGWGFGFTITLTNVPSGHNYALRVYRTPLEGGDWEEIDFQDEGSLGDDEILNISGGWGNDTGLYYVEVTSTTGSTCKASYDLTIEN